MSTPGTVYPSRSMRMIVQQAASPDDARIVSDGLIEHPRAADIEPRNYRELAIFQPD
jgi:hypothetical protein